MHRLPGVSTQAIKIGKTLVNTVLDAEYGNQVHHNISAVFVSYQ
uniref:Uncharacterized protein n=1 Tax=Arundo donax TaxID=35708 RepID=A0A0A9HP25_ARUDO